MNLRYVIGMDPPKGHLSVACVAKRKQNLLIWYRVLGAKLKPTRSGTSFIFFGNHIKSCWWCMIYFIKKTCRRPIKIRAFCNLPPAEMVTHSAKFILFFFKNENCFCDTCRPIYYFVYITLVYRMTKHTQKSYYTTYTANILYIHCYIENDFSLICYDTYYCSLTISYNRNHMPQKWLLLSKYYTYVIRICKLEYLPAIIFKPTTERIWR